MTIGQQINSRRKQLGISAEKLADTIGVSPATIYRYENGEIIKIPTDRLSLIANALSTTPYKLQSGLTIGKKIAKSTAHNIALHRTESGLSQKQFADILCVDESYILGLESGEIALDRDILFKICDALHLLPSNFIPRDDEEISDDEEYLLSRREKEPDQLVLTGVDKELYGLLMQIPEEQKKLFLEMGRVFVNNLNKG